MTLTTPNTPPSVRYLKKQLKARRRYAAHCRARELPPDHFYPDFFEEWADGLEQSAKALEIEIQIAESEAMVRVLDSMIAMKESE